MNLSKYTLTNNQLIESIIDINKTSQLLMETEHGTLSENKRSSLIKKIKKPSSAQILKFDDLSVNNKFSINPTGIIIQDTFNNPIFPIDLPIIDDFKFNLPSIKSRFKAYYCPFDIDFLPWHFTVEMIDGKYYFFQTRPLDMKFPINNLEFDELLKTNSELLYLTKSTKAFIETKPFDIQNAIHICIIGDTSKDVYIEKLYEMIGRICCSPSIRFFKLPGSTNLKVINFNLGNKFIFNKLDLYLKR